ncbi:Rad2 nuclease [Ascosphaera atra]|nr:Rad2 nuclease [Ascosphaera atra]
MARLFIEELRRLNIEYTVAPYEADAQLVYLESKGIINGIISEDSDLLVFGAKRLLSKLDKHGDCIELNRSDFTACKDVSLIGWTDAEFRAMCILSGCDYLANIPGMGLKTAYRHMRKYKNVERVVQMLRFDNKTTVPQDYLESFRRAEQTFLYQRVFCPEARRLVTLNPIPSTVNEEQLDGIGEDLDEETAIQIAMGNIDPSTKKPFNLPHPYTPRTGLLQEQRPRILSAKKPGQSIEKFFTPKRTPLAELDPNSLTPTESQRDLLRRNSGLSWAATVATGSRSAPPNLTDRRFSARRSLDSPVPASQAGLRRSLTTTHPSTDSVAKRQRLCFDADDDVVDGDTPSKPVPAAESKSRFFAKPKSPLGLGKARAASGLGSIATRKRGRNSSFGVYQDSDANAEDKVGNVVALTDGKHGVSASGELAAMEQGDKARAEEGLEAEASSGQRPNGDQAHTASNPEEDAFEQALDHHIKSHNSKLLEKYKYPASTDEATIAPQPHPVSKTPLGPPRRPLGRSSSLSDKRVRANKAPKLPSTPTPFAKMALQNNALQRATPLQRLKERAMVRSRSLNALPTDAMTAHTPSSSQPRQEQQRRSLTVSAGELFQAGSEDMIVPNSESEDESLSDLESEGGNEQTRPSLSFKDFMFVPGTQF